MLGWLETLFKLNFHAQKLFSLNTDSMSSVSIDIFKVCQFNQLAIEGDSKNIIEINSLNFDQKS